MPLRSVAGRAAGATSPQRARLVHPGAPPEQLLAHAAAALPAPGARRGARSPPQIATAIPHWLGGDPAELDESLSDPPDRAGRASGGRASENGPRGSHAGPASEPPRRAQDEISEMIAFLEDMPLRRAVKRLELAEQDLVNSSAPCCRLISAAQDQKRSDRQPTAGADRPKELRGSPAGGSTRAAQRIGRHVRELDVGCSAGCAANGKRSCWRSGSRICSDRGSSR